MCMSCGCGAVAHEHQADAAVHRHHHHTHEQRPPIRVLSIEERLLAKNDRLARANREWIARRRLYVLNLIGSPGAGKTALLEATVARLASPRDMAVLEGDQATARDAERIAATGCAVQQINTGTGCHLDAPMIRNGLEQLAPHEESLVFVENVGNLVCPALFDLGEAHKIVALSVTEGDDKPLKYPHVFSAASLLVITKMDLLPYVPFDVAAATANARGINPSLEVCRVSAKTGEGMDEWMRWLDARPAAEVAL
jgi:hydrogenase nickel incorporation protein HypB